MALREQTKTTLHICNCYDAYSTFTNDMSITSFSSTQRPRTSIRSIASFIFGTEQFTAAYAPLNIDIEQTKGQFSAMVLRPGNKFWLFHMPRNVVDMVNKVLVEATKPLQRGHILVNLHSKLNAIAFYLPTIEMEGSVSFGKRFLCTIFEGMYKLGYDFVTSTDTCDDDKQSTIIFEKSEFGLIRLNEKCQIMCIASKQANRLLLVRCPDSVVNVVIEAIRSTWNKGIVKTNKVQSDYLTNNLPIYEMVLGGEPWNSRGDQSTSARRLWLKVNY